MIEKEQEFLEYIAGEVDNLISQICYSYDIDREFYNFNLTCTILDSNCERAESREILFDDHVLFCRFCGERTYFTDDDGAICADCYGRIVD